MNSTQIFVYYLLSQLIIQDAQQNKDYLPAKYVPGDYNFEAFHEFISNMGGSL